MSRIAAVTGERQIALIEPNGKTVSLTEMADGVMWGRWGAQSHTTSHSWPSFSPDGNHIAAFRMRSTNHAAVLVAALDGVSSAEVIDLPDQLPIYLQWSQDSARLAVVSQREDELFLTTGRAAEVGGQRVLAKGSPLFFSWTGQGQLAAFIGGGSATARMMLLDPDGRRATEVLPGTPGDFCAPIVDGNDVIYGVHESGQARIVKYEGNGETRYLPGGKGLLAFVGSPDGRYLARAVASGGDGTPYSQLTIVDVAMGTEKRISDMACLAFTWTPDGSGLVVARVDSDRGLVEWFFVDIEGTARHLVDLLPTRDLRFYLRFFEQYSQSHPIVDPESKWLLVTGVVRGQGSQARVWRVPLRGGSPEEVAEGHFATFGPPIGH